MQANIYQNKQGEYILEWQTENMQAPVFNQFKTREEAEQAEIIGRLAMDRLKAGRIKA